MRRLIRSLQSVEDEIAIWRYIAADNASAADHLIGAIGHRIQSLRSNPFIGERQPQFGEETRRLIVGNYLVFYEVVPDAVHILRIFHAAREIEDLS